MKAAIDIGTNTVLLLVANKTDQGLDVVCEKQRMPRLGKGVDKDGRISNASAARVTDVLIEYRELLNENYPDLENVIVTATSAVRDATNRKEFISFVKDKTGFNIQLLSGDEEAEYTARGALSTLPLLKGQECFILDIGGGSTEIAQVKKGKIARRHSFDMGSVRFTERFLMHDPPYQEEISACKSQVQEMLRTFRFRPGRKAQAIGVAGTLTSLAAIDLQVEKYDPARVNGHKIESKKLYKGIDIFSLHTHEELLELSPDAMKGREDIFLAGLLILEGFMKFYDFKDILVSTGGIRHGAILND